MSIITTSGRSGSPLAHDFQDMFDEYAHLVYRTAYGVTGNHEDAEDVLQTVFLRLIRRPLPSDMRRNPKAYLYRAAVNRSVDMIRARRRQAVSMDAEQLDLPARPGDDAEARDDELHRHLYAAIAELKPQSAEIVILRYIHNKSDAEIARMLGVSRGTIALRLFRSRARLRKIPRARLGELR
jgi:RNA polymerase sigma-70 factor (ECF subfamily)